MTVANNVKLNCANCEIPFHPTSKYSIKAAHPCCSMTCRRDYNQRPDILAARKEYWQAKHRVYRAIYVARDKEKYKKRWALAREKNCIKRREQAAAYRKLFPEKVREATQKWQATHREYARLSAAQRRAAHPEISRQYSKQRRALKAGAPINDFTAAQWEEMKVAYDYRCVYCEKKKQRLTQDHITPLSQGGSHTASNIVPACRSCNSKKHTGPPLVPVQPLLLLLAANR